MIDERLHEQLVTKDAAIEHLVSPRRGADVVVALLARDGLALHALDHEVRGDDVELVSVLVAHRLRLDVLGVHWPRFMPLPFYSGAGPESGGLYVAVWFVLGCVAFTHLLVRASSRPRTNVS